MVLTLEGAGSSQVGVYVSNAGTNPMVSTLEVAAGFLRLGRMSTVGTPAFQRLPQ